ncbi:SLC13 family permease [Desmospora activa]|uniref:Sodium-dependent dicarboxylate transporter SdcS n=1 Tax=Desmospora activa DSM 45169 TaxID=1121389 RepID=A0A2T4ZB84_9BACL|nr:DASS family sodium-coupled anion symporter [Desmospora activa]PTM59163.1 sodium-dependent dicarboxylate transporter 2/3/5 [Desmospora activa DSM 45169]
MSRSFVAAAWNQLWQSHSQTKQLLLFAMPKKQAKDSTQSSSDKQVADNPEPPTYRRSQLVGLLLGPALFLWALLFFSPEGLSAQGQAVLATTLWVAVWWITEAIPIPATSLLPLILLPVTGALEGDAVASAYGDPIVFLFLGGFMIALAMEKWNLHKRMALTIISMIGTSTQRIVLGIMSATAFLSMWISNTAAVMMMIPIGTAIIYQVSQTLKDRSYEYINRKGNFEKSVILGTGFAGTIGGLATLIGTPPNVILAAMVSKLYGIQISFAGWMLIGVPISIILLFCTWFYLSRIVFPAELKALPGGKEMIQKELKSLGNTSSEEKAVLAVFLFAAFMWISRSFIWDHLIPGISDTMIAIIAAIILFLIPASQKGKRVLDWQVSKDVPWGVLLLFGGGLAIAAGFGESGLAEWIGNQLTVLEGINFLLIIVVTAALVLFLTEITSNTATATMILPILASLALAINVHPYALMVPAAMAANCAFMLPVGTPPNAIMFATGKIGITEMAKTGVWINIFTLMLVILAVYFFLPIAWGIDLTTYPASMK